ncbi:MAG: cbb3-type cytochrome oxidase assembly protein CcoS [Bacteroidetes bacterium]|nr:cbb3-type cytochrome oxidase assembly protein CcoS [Bacteroidota bacterium]
MDIIILLIACSFTIAAGFLIAFLWAVRNGQYDDKYTPSVRILLDEEGKNKVVGRKNEVK